MKRPRSSIVSSKVAMLLLLVFIVVIGTATFIEEAYDTTTTRLLVYDALWFEFLMLILVIFYVLMVFQKNLWSTEKIPQLIFHLSFAFLFLGGGVSRYFGYEANMYIQENEAVNQIFTTKPYLQLRVKGNEIDYISEEPLYFSQIAKNDFQLEFTVNTSETLYVAYKNYTSKASEFFERLGTPEEKIDYRSRNPGEDGPDALEISVTYKDQIHDVIIFYDQTRYVQQFRSFDLDGLELEIAYGPKPVVLPFSLQLLDFTLSKYPGTNIPSASESKVLVIDNRENMKREYLIAKNKVLDYDGYRFFQTSYDDNETATILTVNYDYYGTRITYFGYGLMIVGALLILFFKRSHFSQLDVRIREVRKRRKSLYVSIFLLIGIHGMAFSQNNIQKPVNAAHADLFGHLIVQTYEGRFTSVHSLAVDVIHKITGKDNFHFEGKGNMDAMHMFLDWHLDPEYWKQQELIVVREKALRELLGVEGKHAPFSAFFDEKNNFKLADLAQRSYQKKAASRTTFDREVLKVTERVNIFNMAINGTLLKLFPDRSSENNRWLSWNEPLAYYVISDVIVKRDPNLGIQEYTFNNILKRYFVSTSIACALNDYSVPEDLIRYIDEIQQQLSPPGLLPSKKKIEWEVVYNKTKVFDSLKYMYAFLGVGLLLISFIRILKARESRKLKLVSGLYIGLILVAFLYQTFGMALRWYIGGHAPWSNGYEVLLLVAWGGMIAGFSVIRYSKITLAATALLAFLILMTAGHSYYDPQLTNLNPVLKSFWLIIHVAIITIGYGFLTLSFILGLITLLIHIFRRQKKHELFTLVIEELTLINEKLVTVGMLLTAIGTFIGCIWANESWGSYWAWNAKQVWSLIIVLIYGVVLHFKYIPKLGSNLAFNIGAILSFSSVLMTFIGVNYYFTKGLHSYASDDPPIFPIWAWISILILVVLIVTAVIRSNYGSRTENFTFK